MYAESDRCMIWEGREFFKKKKIMSEFLDL